MNQNFPKRILGHGNANPLEVSALGLGCMGMSWAYGPANDEDSLAVLRRAFDLGITFWDTAEIYGPFLNEELLGKAIQEVGREQLVISTKFAWEFNDKNERTRLNSSPTHIKKTVEGSLKRLGVETIDLYYQHRVDPATPIEETMQALSDLVREGKIKHIGLSEASASTIERAHKIHPLTAVQSEYSLWERGVEEKVLPMTKKLGIGFVPYSPMGRGFLTGQIKKLSDLPASDWRRTNPRFNEENFAHNLSLEEEVTRLAKYVGATPSQVSLAWLLKQDAHIVPIPGTKRISFLEENAKAATLKISDADWQGLEIKLATFQTAGTRYTADMMKLLDIDLV